jgi:hypothetical protein
LSYVRVKKILEGWEIREYGEGAVGGKGNKGEW